ncbi:UNVERIFIED_ORG: hypothetical protein EDC92_13212 [Dietzia maris]|jgi:hypothetical protein|uniref:hypothetical protein n=1 Tax=Dietzia TaxID=37914 RepID=UPI0010F1DD98|nr:MULTISPECIES: hypothetical protein [unclassified Dietzia]MDV3357298.1 hypothetical protein [Dietzia sp. IN118]
MDYNIPQTAASAIVRNAESNNSNLGGQAKRVQDRLRQEANDTGNASIRRKNEPGNKP